MKKILLIVFLCVLTVPVYGLENIKYKYYRLNKVEGPLVFKGEASEDFPMIDENNPIKSDLSELSAEMPELKEGREVYEYDGFHYLKTPLIDEIEVRTNSTSNISQIELSLLDGKIDYDSENNGSLGNDEKANFILKSPVDLNNLKIDFCTGSGDNFHIIIIDFKSEGVIASSLFVSARPNSSQHITGKQSVLNDSALKNVYLTEKTDDNNLKYVGKIKLYQYFDYKYQSYKLEREYYPDYLYGPIDDYIYRDSDDYIIVSDNTENESTSEDIFDGKSEDAILEEISNDETNIDTISKGYINDMKVIPKNVKSEKSDNLNSESNKKVFSPDTNIIKPKQYQSVLKVDDKKTISNSVDNKIYYYFLLVLLTLLLLIMLKIRKRFKQSYS